MSDFIRYDPVHALKMIEDDADGDYIDRAEVIKFLYELGVVDSMDGDYDIKEGIQYLADGLNKNADRCWELFFEKHGKKGGLV